MNYQAIFWDYDNTILSTFETHWEKHVVTLKSHGITLDEKFRKRIYHCNGLQNWEWMNDELGLEVPQHLYLNEIDAYFQKKMQQLPFRSGVEQAFNYFKENDIPQAIVTNARTASAKPILEAKNIDQYMKFCLYKEDYEGHKPDPEPYLHAIKKMEELIGSKLDPIHCLAIEDDPKGVESAHKAGLKVVHRKLTIDQEPSPLANFDVFEKRDFIELIKYGDSSY